MERERRGIGGMEGRREAGVGGCIEWEAGMDGWKEGGRDMWMEWSEESNMTVNDRQMDRASGTRCIFA